MGKEVTVYLKSIELQGFKSFPDKTKLVFDTTNISTGDTGVTVIVGPNGSGKSNIADAMRWVLGEISSKTLRGTKMEDVIFGGADSRRPMGYAEVSVTFDNTGDFARLDCPYDEVTVTRRYFRAGESEYFINRKSVRLRDIYELFMNTGIGRDGYSIIGQGRIADMVSRKSDERRGIFEDASGIAKYRHKKSEAERKLSQTEDNMTRINDVFFEVSSQVEPLYKESEKAKKAIDLMESKKKADVSLWLYDTEKYRVDIASLEESHKRSAFDLAQIQDSIDALDARSEKLYEASQSSKMASAQVLNMIKEQTNKSFKLEGEFKVNESNIRHINELIDSALMTHTSLNKTVSDENVKAESHKKRIGELEEKKKEISATLEKAEDDIFECKIGINNYNNLIDTAFADIKAAENQAVDIKVRISVLENAKNSGSDRNAGILADIEEYERELTALDSQKTSKERTVKSYVDALSGIDSDMNEKKQGLVSLNEEYGEVYNSLNSAKLRFDSASHRIATIKAMEEQFEGYSNSVRYIMKQYKEGNVKNMRGEPSGRIYGPLSKVISVDTQYVTAIETALGANLQNIVVEDEETAKAAMYTLKRGEAGRATFFPLTAMRPQTPTPEMVAASGFAGYIGTADKLCAYDDKFNNVLSSLLGRTLVFDNIENATVMAKAQKYKVRVVTLDGQQINAGGSFTGGSVKQGGGVLSRADEIKRLSSECDTLTDSIKKYNKELSSIKSKIDDTTDDISDMENRRSLIEVLKNTEAGALSEIIAKVDATSSLIEKMRYDYDQIILMSEKYDDDIVALKEQEASINTRITEMGEVRVKKNQEKVELEFKLEELEAEKTRLIIAFSENNKDIEGAVAMLDVTRERINNCLEEQKSIEVRVAEHREHIENITKAQAENRKMYAESEKELEALNKKRNELEEGNIEFERKLNEITTLTREKISQKELISIEHTKTVGKLQTLRDAYDKLASKLWDDYELTRTDAIALGYPEVTRENRAEYIKIQTDCRNKLRVIGHVDLDAVNKYKEVKERYDYMSSQINDLQKAKGELTSIITKLEEEMKSAFIESFDKINENFKVTFSDLFGGGHAELFLTEPDNILESGIEIKAAPPGKIIKNLMQLSGGEQAFVGVALFFAILKVNPTPFCILDEIEAALDEVNVERLAKYIKRYSDGTQFIMITHRRGTMAAATRLYGVTMPEHGISKILALDIRDIEKNKEGEWNGIFE